MLSGCISVWCLKLSYQSLKLSMKYWVHNLSNYPKILTRCKRKCQNLKLRLAFGMIQTFGCIDGTHIPIKRPLTNSEDYFNSKNFFSLNVQAICDSQGSFMDVECKWPGSVHDAKVFSNSYVCQSLQNGNLAKSHLSLLPGFEAIPNYLIGDPAYPLTPFCMKEFQYCAENKHVLFNHMLRSARNQTESAFGRLKARWRISNLIYCLNYLHVFCTSQLLSNKIFACIG